MSASELPPDDARAINTIGVGSEYTENVCWFHTIWRFSDSLVHLDRAELAKLDDEDISLSPEARNIGRRLFELNVVECVTFHYHSIEVQIGVMFDWDTSGTRDLVLEILRQELKLAAISTEVKDNFDTDDAESQTDSPLFEKLKENGFIKSPDSPQAEA